MNYADIVRFTSGLLQFGVACYALRLGRRFNAVRVGWLLFSGLSLLALAYLLLPLNPFRGSVQLGVKVDAIYALISLLLIAGMVHLDLRFKNRLQTEQKERQAQSQWGSQVQQKLEETSKVNEHFQQTVGRLEAELAEQKRALEQADKLHQEQLMTSRETEEELRRTIARLEAEVADLKAAREHAEQVHQEQLTASQQAGQTAGTTGLATSLYPGVSGMLGNMNTASRAADDLARSRMISMTRLTKLVCEYARDAGSLHASLGAHANKESAGSRAGTPVTGTAVPADRHRSTKKGRNPKEKRQKAGLLRILATGPQSPKNLTKRNPLGRQLQVRLVQLGQQLSADQRLLLQQIDFIKKNLARVKESGQQSYDLVLDAIGADKIAELTGEVLPFQAGQPAESAAPVAAAPESFPGNLPGEHASAETFQEHLLSNVTQTGTEIANNDQVIAREEASEPLPHPAEVRTAA